MGKSTLINSLFFKEERGYKEKTLEGAALAPCTDKVTPLMFVGSSELSFKITIYNTPGLQDGNNQDKQHLREIRSQCNSAIHIIVYCTKIGEPMRECEERALKNLVSVFLVRKSWIELLLL